MADLTREDWFGLWAEIMLFVARTVPKELQDRCQAKLQDAKWEIAHAVMERLREEPRIPSNIYGAITTAINLERRSRWSRGLGNATPVDESPYDTTPIAGLMGGVIEELYACKRAGRLQLQISVVGKPYPNIEEWHNAGCPATWSDLNDRFLSGYYLAWKKEQDSGDTEAVIDYMRKAVKALRAIRLKKDGPTNQTAGDVPHAMEVDR